MNVSRNQKLCLKRPGRWRELHPILPKYGNREIVRPVTAKFRSRSLSVRRNVTPAAVVASSSSGPDRPRTSSCSGRGRRGIRSASSSDLQPHTTPSDLRTPRSATSTTTDPDSCYIVAISEGRGQARGEVGLAAMDVRRPWLVLSQMSDTKTYSNTLAKINLFHPVDVLIPNTFCEISKPNKLMDLLKELFPGIGITTVQRRHFNEGRGQQQIQHLCAPEFKSVEVLITQKYYALSAANALLKYVEYAHNVIFAPKSLKVEYQGTQNTTVIDMDTAHSLELVHCLQTSTPHFSLFGIMNNCETPGGKRLLRANLLQPPCDLNTITTRLDCVQELVDKPDLFENLQNVMSKFGDVEQLLSLCMQNVQQEASRTAETQINYTLQLKTTLEIVPPLGEALQEAIHPFFAGVREMLEDPRYGEMLAKIKEVFNDDAKLMKGSTAYLQRCFAIRPGINGLLDVARKTYSEIVDDINERVTQLAEETNLPLRMLYTTARGFHIIIGGKFTKDADLPAVFVQVQRNKSSLSFTTEDLIHFNRRCEAAIQEIDTMSNVINLDLLSNLREHIGSLYNLCESITNIDMLLSFARVSSFRGYVRPQFGNVLDIKKGRHPILEFLTYVEPIPNDTLMTSVSNFHVITGPNMSGKSVYLRQVALIQLMAQVGCFVPAENATLRIADHIFSRIGCEDKLDCNASTFLVEMKEMNYILQRVTDCSLVIVDELGRGTSCEEGTAIAWALSERLLETKAFIFFATHFILLTKLQDLYYNVTNYHLDTSEEAVQGKDRTQLNYTHKLVKGVTKVENYGIKLAQVSNLPPSVVQNAQQLVEQINVQRKPLPVVEGENLRERRMFELISELQVLAEKKNLSTEELQEAFKQLQVKYSDTNTSLEEVNMEE